VPKPQKIAQPDKVVQVKVTRVQRAGSGGPGDGRAGLLLDLTWQIGTSRIYTATLNAAYKYYQLQTVHIFRQSHGMGKYDKPVIVLFGQEIFKAAPGSRIIPKQVWQTKEFSYKRA
jgi:hypothetical protein